MIFEELIQSKNITSTARVQLFGKISDKIFNNASQSYGIEFQRNKIVGIIDDTIFSSGKDGCVIGFSGIAFKAAFVRPKYIKYDDIKNLSLVKKCVIINNGEFTFEFHLPDESELFEIFAAIAEWIEIKKQPVSSENIFDSISKIKYVKSNLQVFLEETLEEILNESDIDEDTFMPALESCIDELSILEEKSDNHSLTPDEIQKINTIHKLMETCLLYIENPYNTEFNYSVFEPTRFDGRAGSFFRGLFKPIVISINENVTREKRLEKVASFANSEKTPEQVAKLAKPSFVENNDPEITTNPVIGKIFVQSSGIVGLASYHFESNENIYINYTAAPKTWRFDDGEPFPPKKKFSNIYFDLDNRTFFGLIDWAAEQNRTVQGSRQWLYIMKFNDKYSGIPDGYVIGSSSTHKFGKDLFYMLSKQN